MAKSSFTYVAYIRTTTETLWSALTDPEIMKQYWFGVHCECHWTVGSPWRMVYPDGHISDTGEILDAKPAQRLVIRWQHEYNPEFKAEGETNCTMELKPNGPAVRLTLTHTIERESSKLMEALSVAWPMALSNLKSFLETGLVVLQQRFPIENAD